MLKKRYFWILSVSLIIFLFAFSQVGRSYDDKTTHPGLTDEIVDFYNLSLADQISGEEKEWIVRGSIEEDTPPRWINHFYDPTTGEGWLAENLGRVPSVSMRFLSKVFFNLNTDVVSSVNWLHNEELQAKYADYGGNCTWENAIRQYAKGEEKEAYLMLGHILHLLEDKSVPDHTRNDTHAHEGSLLTADGGSPYEDYAMAFTRQTLTLSDSLKKNGQQPIILKSIDQYFENLANYSNKYFFSEHTINSTKYNNPKILRQTGDYGYGSDFDGTEFPLTRVKMVTKPLGFGFIAVYSLIDEDQLDDTVLSAYFSRLSSAAVLNGAGVIKLFKDEAEKAKADSALLKPEPKVSWWQENLSLYYGSIAFYNQAKSTLANLIGGSQETGNNLLANADNFYQNNFQAPAFVQSTAVLGQKIINTVAKPIIKENPLAPNPASAQTIVAQQPTSPQPSPSKGEGETPQVTITVPGEAAPQPYPLWIFSNGSGSPLPPPPPSGTPPQAGGDDTNATTTPSEATSTPPDITAPQLTILTAPAPYLGTTTAEFEFSADETPVIFVCRLDNTDWQSCEASSTFENLAEGNHLLEARAVDEAANTSEIASSSWLVDLTAPTPSINQLETEYAQTGFTVEWSGEDPQPTPAVASTSPQPSPAPGEGVSGIASFDLELQIATSSSSADEGGWQTWHTATTATSSIFDRTATSGDVILFRIRAADRAGNIGAWSGAQTKISALPAKPLVFCNQQYSYPEIILNDNLVTSQNLITQTLTASGSPYYLGIYGTRGTPIVDGDLTIEPGVVIKLGGWYRWGWYDWPISILVKGKIIARGTEEHPIIFTAMDDPDYCAMPGSNPENLQTWGGFTYMSSGNIFEHAYSRFGGNQGAALTPILGN